MEQQLDGDASIFLQAVLEQSRDFFLAVDLKMQVRTFNDVTASLFRDYGIKIELGGKIDHYFEQFPEKLIHVKRALQGDRFSVLESWKEQTLQTEYTPLHDPRGQKIGAALLGRVLHTMSDADIDPVKLAKEEKEFFWPYTVVFVRSSDAQNFSRQPSWERLTGQSWEEQKGHGWLNAHHPDNRKKIWNMWQAARACKKPHAFAMMSKIWNSSLSTYRHTLIHAQPQYDRQGNLSYWNCSGIDVHELYKLQEDLAMATQRLNVVLEAGQIGTWDWDLTTGYLKGDKTQSKLFGREHTNYVPASEILAQIVDRAPVEAAIQAAIEKDVPYDSEFQIQWPDGSLHWLRARGEPYRVQGGHESLLGVNWDITARKLMEEERERFVRNEEEIRRSKQAEEFERKRAEEAEENQRRQEEFIDTVCHEIRNPLAGIYGGAHLAIEELNTVLNSRLEPRAAEAAASTKGHLISILKCAEQQKIIVDDVLDLSKLQNNKIDLVSLPFQLSACFDLVVNMFQSRIQEKNLDLETNFPRDDIFIKADMYRLQQVIINLISNAVKFTQKGKIAISGHLVEQNADGIVLEVKVRDSGVGISREDIPVIFDRFSQVGKRRRQYGGTGLGLAISKRLVEAMDGEISVDSIPGMGTQFTFRIKAQKASQVEILQLIQEQYAIPSAPEKSNLRRNILVVDDNSLNQKILTTYLEKAGHTVQVASDGFEAVQKAAQQYFDIIFMDVEMPNMNGLEATVALRQRERELNIRSAIIGLSGNARKEKIDAALESGMDFYLTKPYHKDEIMKVISKFAPEQLRPRVRNQSRDDLERLAKQQKT